MSETKTDVKTAKKGTPPAAVTLPEDPNTLTLPADTPKRGRRAKKEAPERPARTIECEPGQTYHMNLGDGDKAVRVPFTLPADVVGKQTVTLASADPNWLGRDGHVLRAHFCSNQDGTVCLQPHGKNAWKANVFAPGRITFA